MAVDDCQLLTNHARVLLCIAREPTTRIRDIAQCADLTERTTHRMVSELCEAGYITRNKMGARNSYKVHPEVVLRDPLLAERQVGALLRALLDPQTGDRAAA